MDNQHREIKGYRELNMDEIMLINEIKEQGVALQATVERLSARDADQRWVAIGVTHLQQGLMALTRAVAKPTFF